MLGVLYLDSVNTDPLVGIIYYSFHFLWGRLCTLSVKAVICIHDLYCRNQHNLALCYFLQLHEKLQLFQNKIFNKNSLIYRIFFA